jgi:AcrR family transcriptional regulator
MPRPDVSEERIQQIIEAALAVFAREGFAQARMDDIAKTAGLSKGAVYLYFESKDAIIAAILKFFFTQEMRFLRRREPGPEPIGEQLLDLTRRMVGAIEHMKPFLSIAFEFYAIAGRRKDVRQFLLGIFDEYRAFCRDVIQQGIERGEFRAVDPDATAVTILAVFEGLALFWLVDPQNFTIPQQAEASMRLILDGLAPRQE